MKIGGKTTILILAILIGFLLYTSCDPFRERYPCKSHEEWVAENKTSKEIILEYVDRHGTHFSQSDLDELYEYINQTPYDTFVVIYGNPQMYFLGVQFLISGVSEATTYILEKASPYSYYGRCGEKPSSNGSIWETYIYNLTDTTEFDLSGRIGDGYTGSEPFTSLQWYYDTATDTTYVYCYLTIDSSSLAAMHKDYTMLEKFADYYSHKR